MPYATNQGVKIHYEVEGQGPPIILQHGVAGGAERHGALSDMLVN